MVLADSDDDESGDGHKVLVRRITKSALIDLILADILGRSTSSDESQTSTLSPVTEEIVVDDTYLPTDIDFSVIAHMASASKDAAMESISSVSSTTSTADVQCWPLRDDESGADMDSGDYWRAEAIDLDCVSTVTGKSGRTVPRKEALDCSQVVEW